MSAAVFNGASSAHSINGGAQVTGNVGALTDAGHTFGGRGGGVVQGFNSKATRHIIYSVAHSAAQVLQVVAYLRAWSGV